MRSGELKASLDKAEQNLHWALQEAVDVLVDTRAHLLAIEEERRGHIIRCDKPEEKVFELLESIREAQDAVAYAKGELPTGEPNAAT